MKILIITPYYPSFLKHFYTKKPEASSLSYQAQKSKIHNELFGIANFYSENLSQLGHPTQDIIINNTTLQTQWLRESSKTLSLTDKVQDYVFQHIPLLAGKIAHGWELSVLRKQIKDFKPDVIYTHAIGYLDPAFLQSIKSEVKLIVGQIASPLPSWVNFEPYDLIITSFPHYLDIFKSRRISSEFLPLSFMPSVLEKITPQKRKYDVTFIGGISKAHTKGLDLLYQLADQVKLDVWGYGKQNIDPSSKLYQYHHGEAWGIEMYRLMLQSKITINRHIDVAEGNANNLRLYESTGCGAMLITDQKDNLRDMFEVDKEVVAYRDFDDLTNKIKYYLKHDKERRKIAKAGQKRTHRDHTYQQRMIRLVEILHKYI